MLEAEEVELPHLASDPTLKQFPVEENEGGKVYL